MCSQEGTALTPEAGAATGARLAPGPPLASPPPARMETNNTDARPMLRFEDFPLWLNLALFGFGALAIWMSGTRLSRYADAIAERTGVGKAFVGALLLGGITSLPEAATTVTAAALGSAALAVNNIFGGVAMQVAILAAADAVVPGHALTARIRKPSVLLQAALLILVLALAAAGIAVGEWSIFGVGVWSTAILGVAILAFFLIHQHKSRETWEPEASPRDAEGEEEGDTRAEESAGERSTGRLVLLTSAAGVVILVAGFLVARSGEALAGHTGLGESFVGLLLLAVATSLPEISTTLSAARMGQFAMAFSNIFGANILDTAVIFLADLAFAGGPVLGEVGTFSLIGSLLGLMVTGVYLVGLLERRKRVVLGMGIDSLLVLLLYVAGVGLLYTLR